MLRDSMEELYRENRMFRKLLYPFVKVYDFYRLSILSEEKYTKNRFRRIFGYSLDLRNPRTLNEKIQWLKLNERTKLHTLCSDKFAVREYVKEKIGGKYLIPLLYHTVDYRNLTPEKLPEKPFIIKTTHDTGGYHIVRNKTEANWKEIRRKFKKLMDRDYYKISKEWQYKNITPRIIVEELLMNDDGQIPNDYKFHCFHGKVKLISVDIDREVNHKRNFYSKDWKLLPFTWSMKVNNRVLWENGRDIAPPGNLETILPIIEKLAVDFNYVRVDFYFVKGAYYFGEVTFHHGGGFEQITPFAWDIKLGEMIDLKQ